MGNCVGTPDSPNVVHKEYTIKDLSNGSMGITYKQAPQINTTSSYSYKRIDFDEYPDGKILEEPNLRVFSFAELKNATGNFKPDSILGEGGFGRVYKGWVDESTLSPSKAGVGMVVAVKKLNPERGSAYQKFSWELRLKIAIGAASGLAFLHTSEKQIIYRDFKASNILLDSDFNAKLSDFGLAKVGPTGEKSHVTTRVMGTFGYAAPEYVATGHLYVKSDVYGFGVVLLELMTGLRALDTSRPSGQHNLVDFARPILTDRRKLTRLIDPRLDGQYPFKGAWLAAQLTLRCIANEPRNRPSMLEVVEALEEIKSIKMTPMEDDSPQDGGQNSKSNGFH
ncbi:Protein kinase superfamily protein [Rhynchospora pubera]|uniref:Protein kinase superfamily protein n=1 Tax=Rhynchospora pubera TaxID=906938 RepID=A0AAV8G9Q1_9POAL|nr:Protein kinase superfamily protein [Rhynchospora pubera]